MCVVKDEISTGASVASSLTFQATDNTSLLPSERHFTGDLAAGRCSEPSRQCADLVAAMEILIACSHNAVSTLKVGCLVWVV